MACARSGDARRGFVRLSFVRRVRVVAGGGVVSASVGRRSGYELPFFVLSPLARLADAGLDHLV